ncbi:amino acid transporter [Trypanosoma conorhini]|uniref:Amino acid transporter n=1 Tax=Trypanosoma conorhini TaxID=83891 RepID=A0A422N8G5_9TRYP|nr:amino acid transporter [Trypanosoma conorhini]RNF01747.1 amino acid transporter [Trypanosoma conorhini]
MLLSFIVHVLTGVFGYLDLGSRATVSALLLYDPVKEPAAMVAYVGVLVELCASCPLSCSHPPQLPQPQLRVGPRQAAVLEALHLRRWPRGYLAALRPLHPKGQHGVWPRWCAGRRCAWEGGLLALPLRQRGGRRKRGAGAVGTSKRAHASADAAPHLATLKLWGSNSSRPSSGFLFELSNLVPRGKRPSTSAVDMTGPAKRVN